MSRCLDSTGIQSKSPLRAGGSRAGGCTTGPANRGPVAGAEDGPAVGGVVPGELLLDSGALARAGEVGESPTACADGATRRRRFRGFGGFSGPYPH